MRIWQGTTSDGYPLLVERGDHGPWVVTAASVSRSRNESLETALLEAGGGSVSCQWPARLAAVVTATEAKMVSERETHTSRKKAS